MLASSTGVSTVYGYHSVAVPDTISYCRCFFLLSAPLHRPFFHSVWCPCSFGGRIKCNRNVTYRPPSLLSASCSPSVATLGWRLPIAAPFPLCHSLFPSSSMSFFHEATSFSRCKGSMPAHFMGTGLYAYGQCFDENLPFSFHGQQKEYLHKKNLGAPSPGTTLPAPVKLMYNF